MKHPGGIPAILVVIACLWCAGVAAQELTPRSYWPAPVGTRLLVSGYTKADGAVLYDPSVPLNGVDSTVNVALLAYLQTIDLFGRTTNVVAEIPYSWGTVRGFLIDIPASRDFSGLADPSLTLSTNLIGAPAMTLEDFQAFRAEPRPILGASLKIVFPLGDYSEHQLVNVGGNRWAVRAQLGSVLPIARTWLLELTGSAWFYGDDGEFLPGRRKQEPVFGAQVNLVKRFRPGLWASLDLTYFHGGRQTVDGDRLNDTQRNMKLGGTLVFPFQGRHAVKIGYASGIVTEFGNDFDQVLVSYQQLLF